MFCLCSYVCTSKVIKARAQICVLRLDHLLIEETCQTFKQILHSQRTYVPGSGQAHAKDRSK